MCFFLWGWGVKYTEAMGRSICEALARGESLREVCSRGGSPSLQTVYGWLMPGSHRHKPEFLRMYRVARMWQSEAFVERMLEVSRDPALSDGRRRAEMEALKVAAARLEAKKYGSFEGDAEVVIRVVWE